MSFEASVSTMNLVNNRDHCKLFPEKLYAMYKENDFRTEVYGFNMWKFKKTIVYQKYKRSCDEYM